MKKENVLKSCYSVLRRVTPLNFDCGKLCNGKCCKGDEKTGMLLFPGERDLIDSDLTVISKDGCDYAVCNGTCDRNKRPLACRIYPLFPLLYINEKGEEDIKIIFDYRADCPLCESEYEFSKKFIRSVRRTGKYLLLNNETKSFYKDICDELSATAELFSKLSK